MTSVCVVGAGIVGLAVARQLTLSAPDVQVTVVDKEKDVGLHQTGHNSGVVHAGLYYKPGSLKAELCGRGRSLMRDYCVEKGIPFDEVGKLVIAADDDRGGAGFGRSSAARRRTRCRACGGWTPKRCARSNRTRSVSAALHSPRTAITDFQAVTRAYADDVVAAGGIVRLGVTGHRHRAVIGAGLGSRPRTASFTVDHVIVCAGLHADRVAALAGDTDDPAIVPFRGEYLDLRAAQA